MRIEEEGFENLNPKDLNHGWVHFPWIVNGSGRRERMADNVLSHSTVNFFLQRRSKKKKSTAEPDFMKEEILIAEWSTLSAINFSSTTIIAHRRKIASSLVGFASLPQGG